MNHLGNANKMVSDTPRTDEAYFKNSATMYDLAGEMKRVERELNAANHRIDLLTACNADVARIAKERDDALDRIKRLEEWLDEALNYSVCLDLQKENIDLKSRIKRLEEAGDNLVGSADAMEAWRKSKEAKP